jgi:hypothetical protein
MIKLDPSPSEHITTLNMDVDIESARRLIVLVPSETDYSAATRRIWELAKSTNSHVQLLALCKDRAEEPSLRRKLVTMASLLQDGRILVEIEVSIGTNWVIAVRNHYKTGDMIVCFAEQRTGLLQRPLNQILESNIQATLFVISGLTPPRSRSNLFSQIGSWLGFMCIIIGFGILQTKVVQLPGSSLQNIFLILSIFPEFWLIWVWNSLFG